jgi:hypothetical protein
MGHEMSPLALGVEQCQLITCRFFAPCERRRPDRPLGDFELTFGAPAGDLFIRFTPCKQARALVLLPYLVKGADANLERADLSR